MAFPFAPVLLLVLYTGVFLLILIEGSYGVGELLFRAAFCLTCVVFPFLVYYTLVQFCSGTMNRNVALFVPVIVLLTSTWLVFMGALKLFLDELRVDVLEMIAKKFDTRDHILSWSLAAIYLTTVFQGLKTFQKHATLHEEQKKNQAFISMGDRELKAEKVEVIEGERRHVESIADATEVQIGEAYQVEVSQKKDRTPKSSNDNRVLKLFLSQLGISVIFFIIGMDSLMTENACAFCSDGCSELINHRFECDEFTNTTTCHDTGRIWCEAGNRAVFTPAFVASYALSSFCLGVVLFLMVMHSFSSEKSLLVVNFHHKWALLSVIVVIACTWVCGSGALRIIMRVLDTQFWQVVFPTFSSIHKTIAYLLGVMYLLEIPTCFYLVNSHLNDKYQIEESSFFES
eukprot:c19927_g1_i1.p1 GENE.c19927_g1_i1~~c19927_g1_i1.p1  ORF type:complete len:401 (+),score=124.24 c19927_g1_i1:66-1268(+)